MSDHEYKELWDEGAKLVSNHILAHGRPTTPLEPSQIEDMERALQVFRRCADVAPTNPAPLLMLGKIEQRLGRHELSAKWLQLADEKQPNSPIICLELGLALGMLGRYQDSVNVLAKASIDHPRDVSLHYNLAISLLLAGRAEEAAYFFDYVAQLEPTDVVKRLHALAVDVAAGRRRNPGNQSELLRSI